MLARATASAQRWEAEEHARTARLPLPEQVAAGLSWASVRVVSAERAGRNTRLTLRAPKGVVLHGGIEAGDPVTLLSGGRAVGQGLCLGVEDRECELLLRRGEELESDGRPLAVQRALDPLTWRRWQEGLRAADALRSPLRSLLLGEPVSDGLRGRERPDDGAGGEHEAGLNAPQVGAVRAALSAEHLALVHGPPGTGKTRVITALLKAWAARGERVWALADSNAAVDHLVLRAAGEGLRVVRVGHELRVASGAAAFGLRRLVRDGLLGPAIEALDKEIGRLSADGSGAARREARRLRDERRELVDRAELTVLQGADVVASTFGTLAGRAERLPKVRVAVVDEATQAVEPAVWTAVRRVEKLVLVGDPQQLGPVVLEPGNPLERTLLDRLLEPGGPAVPMPMLTVQHRMHRAIQELVNDRYAGRLTPHESVAEARLCELPGVREDALTAAPLLFVDTAGSGVEEELDGATGSRRHPLEAELTARVVGRLRACGVSADAIGIITPYSAQVAALRTRPELEGVEVASVNAFQGREKEAIVCSFVRSNDRGELGFVADDRRLTVALTRARRLWVGIGDSATLCTAPRFAALLERLGEAGALESVWGEWGEGLL